LRAVLAGDVDLIGEDRPRLDRALETSRLRLSAQPSLLRQAGAVIICVPTPIDSHQVPDLTMLRNACTLVATHARPGQTIILMSTTYVGTTRDLLVEPFRNRGMEAGRDIFIAFSPERIDPGNATHPQHTVPRVVGGTDPESAQRASTVLSAIAPSIHLVSSAEAAELTKLYENTFRAVNIAFALEMSQAATALDLSVLEVIDAAATKPYGFMPFYPSAGVGGHCIPCDPHYLLWQLRAQRVELPLIERAMATIGSRPRIVAGRLRELLADAGVPARGARVLIAGASYKPGVQDTRESPAIQLARDLLDLGVELSLWDPIAATLDLHDGRILRSTERDTAAGFDAVVVHTVHPTLDYDWLATAPIVLDATYRLAALPDRAVV
jgi:UDP-N-acetyl-D-glucosamine dehydrogenase